MFFEQHVEFNHILAQIYINKTETTDNKTSEKKARISAHSDKTKDMDHNALIAFCTFYENYVNDEFTDHKTKQIKKTNTFDHCYGDTSVLTKLRFKLKNSVADHTMVKEFTITLYPNSVFIIPLSTNRLYTHEIIPSVLPVSKVANRLGYVVRCSKTKAVFKNGKTYVVNGDNHTELHQPTDEDIKTLKTQYYEENVTDKMIHYGNVYFSLNNGDYIEPIL